MPQRMARRKSGVAKAFTWFQASAVGKFQCRNLLAAFAFDAQQAQNGFLLRLRHAARLVIFFLKYDYGMMTMGVKEL